MSYENSKPVQVLLYDVADKKWVPAPRYRVGFNNILDVEIQETNPTDSTKLNPSLSITESVLGTVTTTTIQQTIDSDVYQQTIEEDSSDNSVTVSAWSQI